jgi:hypothetical protein
VLPARAVAADQHQHTAPLGGPHVDIDPIGPQITEARVLRLSAALEPGDTVRRQPPDPLAE